MFVDIHIRITAPAAWLGTGIMIDRETPLAKIVGQMSLTKSTDVSTQSWVFDHQCKNMILQNWQGGYMHIKYMCI